MKVASIKLIQQILDSQVELITPQVIIHDGNFYFNYQGTEARAQFYGHGNSISEGVRGSEVYLESIKSKHKGDGKILLEYMKDYFKNRGAEVMTLQVDHGFGFTDQPIDTLFVYYQSRGFVSTFTPGQGNAGALHYNLSDHRSLLKTAMMEVYQQNAEGVNPFLESIIERPYPRFIKNKIKQNILSNPKVMDRFPFIKFRGTMEGSEYSGTNAMWHGAGIYFTDSLAEASWYGDTITRAIVELKKPFDVRNIQDYSVQGSGLVSLFGSTPGLQDISYKGFTYKQWDIKLKALHEELKSIPLDFSEGSREGYQHVYLEHQGKEYRLVNRVQAEIENESWLKGIFTSMILGDEITFPIRISEAMSPVAFSKLLESHGYDGVIAENSNFHSGSEYVVFKKEDVKTLNEDNLQVLYESFKAAGDYPEFTDLVEMESIAAPNINAKAHAQKIRKAFIETFLEKGVPKEQLVVALALMDARAISEHPTEPELWYQQIAGIGKGKFQDGTLIRYKIAGQSEVQVGRTVEPNIVDGFYSPLEKRVLEFNSAKASVNKWKTIIGNNDEPKYTGVSEWLGRYQGDYQLPKEEVLSFIRANRIQLVEILKETFTRRDLRVESAIGEDFLFNVVDDAGKIIKQDLSRNAANEYLDRFNNGEGETKYKQYSLGGTNEDYKELLITLPTTEVKSIPNKPELIFQNANAEWVIRLTDGSKFTIADASTQADAALKFNERLEKGEYQVAKYLINRNVFSSGHYEELNILVHLRFNIRVSLDGKKTLFIEESQSDWAKSIRENGEHALAGPYVGQTHAWTKLAMKYALKHAVAIGADQISWTTGIQQASRYNLGAHIEQLSTRLNKDLTYDLYGYKDEYPVVIKEAIKEQELLEIVGKDLTEKIKLKHTIEPFISGSIKEFDNYAEELRQQYNSSSLTDLERYLRHPACTEPEASHRYFTLQYEASKEFKAGKRFESYTEFSGLDLQVGGKGMISYYDELLPSVLKSVVKDLTGDVAEIIHVNLITGNTGELDNSTFVDINNTEDIKKYSKSGFTFYTGETKITKFEAYEFIEIGDKKVRANIPDLSIQRGIAITPTIQEAIHKGMPLFQRQDQRAKGAVETLEDGRKIIHALHAPDFSTAVHEIAHVFEGELTDKERQIITSWSKQPVWNETTSECFARGFERYLYEGKAPTQELAPIFQKAQKWLKNIYRSLKGSAIDVTITPEVKQVFDNLFLKTKQAARNHSAVSDLPTQCESLNTNPRPGRKL